MSIKVPENLIECFQYFDSIITFDQMEEIKTGELKAIHLHHGLGMWIRNNWGLWTKEGPLYGYLKEIGLNHPDDMSNMILESYFAHLKEEPYNFETYVLKCKQYWKDNV